MARNDGPDLSIVVPFYNEEANVAPLVARLAAAMKPLDRRWELVAVDDGSRDATAANLAAAAAKHPEVRPVYFRRNFGQTAAMQAGFDFARGGIIVTMDGDLQNDPADIARLLAKMDESGADIVSGWRKHRQDNALLTNWPSRLANRLLPWVTGVALHDSGCSLKAYRAEVVKDLRIYGEMHRFIPAVAHQYGARVAEVVVSHHARTAGRSKYGIDKSVRVLLDMIQLYFFRRFVHRPLHAFGYLGLLCLVPGGLLAVYLTALKLAGESIGGRPLLMLSVMLILMGVQLIGMGVLGEMLVRIYHEPQGRKPYTLK
jgi:glycosyltransferase involved in cell wall biosynthesis